MSDSRKHLTETGMAKGHDPDLPAYVTEPAGPRGDAPPAPPHDGAEPADLEPAVHDEDLEQHRSTRPRQD